MKLTKKRMKQLITEESSFLSVYDAFSGRTMFKPTLGGHALEINGNDKLDTKEEAIAEANRVKQALKEMV